MESHDAEFSDHGRTPVKPRKKQPFTKVDGTDLFTIEQARALAEMMHTMRIISVRHNFVGLPSKDGSVYVDYIDEDGDEQSRIFWRQDQ
jgi:hypothetical protein